MKRNLFFILLAAVSLAIADDKSATPPAADPYAAVAHFNFGDSRVNIATVEERIRTSAVAGYDAIEAKLLAALQIADTTTDGKRYLLRMLGTVGSAKSVPAIAAYLGNEQLSHPARMALEQIADAFATAALRDALGNVKGKLLVGAISSVGVKRDAKAVGDLSVLLADKDEAIALAAITALGNIGNAAAANALANARVPAALERPVARARLAAAQRLDAKAAVAIYQSLYDTKQPAFVRAAVVTGLAALQPEKSITLVSDALQSDDQKLRAAAARAFFTSSDKKFKAAIAEKLTSLNATGQAALLGVLVDQPEVPAHTALLKLLESSKDETIRVAALQCLIAHGEAKDVPMLVKLATESGPVADAAKQTLEQMHKRGTSDAIVKSLASADGAARSVLLNTVAVRHSVSAMPLLLKLMKGSDVATAKEAIKAVGNMGGGSEMPALAEVLTGTADNGVRDAAVQAAGSICYRVENPESSAQTLVAAFGKATTADGKTAVLRVLPRTKSLAAMAAVRTAAHDKDANISEAAVRALADWPGLAAAPALLEIAKTSSDAKLPVLALRGCTRLIGVSELPANERLKLAGDVLAVAKRNDEKKQTLSALAHVYTLPSLEFLLKHVKDDGVGLDAADAACRLAQEIEIGGNDRARIATALWEIKALPVANDRLRKLVDETVKEVKEPAKRKRR